MTDHPLTDEIMVKISHKCQWSSDIGDTVFRHVDMRCAADWQLKQDIEFFKNFLVVSLGIPSTTADLMAQDFKRAMRPQEDN